MSQPLVSIIMPVYNRETVVGRAIESALAQTYKQWELLAVNDGSTDGSRHVLEHYGNKITLLSQNNKGPYAARNLALSHARGEFIAFLDSDDVWLPRRLEVQLPLFQRPEIGLVFGDAIIVDYGRDGKAFSRARTYHDLWPPSRGDVFRSLLRYDFIPQSSVMVRRACFEKLGPFSLKGTRSSDYAKWTQISMHYRMDYVEDPVFELAIHESNWSRNSLERYMSQQRLFEELLQEAEGQDRQMELRHFLFNLKWSIAMSGKRPGAEFAQTVASVPLTRRLGWLVEFFYEQTLTVVRILMQKLYRKQEIKT
jgi:glycosyltransferase involved in cell wall biosynthesis